MSQREVLQNLQDWYRSQCNDAWEHTYGVKIDTLDNPGWTLSVDLADTALENKPFVKVSLGAIASDLTQDEDWLVCEVKHKKFTAAGGPGKLEDMIGVFLAWADSHS